MNWRTGLRLWFVVNLPLSTFFLYSIYSNHRCVEQMTQLRLFWASQIQNTEKARETNAREIEEGKQQGLKESQLPTLSGMPEQRLKEARDSLNRTFEQEQECSSAGSRYTALGIAVPVSSILVIFFGLWIAAGSRGAAI
jgi:hypothetical protein